MANKIVPNIWFNGNAKEAVDFYLSTIPGSKVLDVDYYTDYMTEVTGHPGGDIVTIDFEMLNTRFIAINAGPNFQLSPAVSFLIECDTQEEIDYYWTRLSAKPEAEQCGWCEDKFGLSWQISPRRLTTMLKTGTEKQRLQVTKAYFHMKKFVLSELEEAFREEQ
jgi:predicted 3-demethylubiquinone-9 3-methyltransferase (glyoxalase superfamily)